MSGAPERGVIGLLTAQALAFGVMLALLVVPANAIFLNAYGAKWLPATYIAVAVFGTGASALVARAARRLLLVRVATVTLSILAALYAASWVILVAGGVWVSAVLLVLFSIAIQLGFVFIGGQAGRLLDVRQMKERFPRVVGGFSVGFLLGGLLGFPLLAVFGSTEHLLLATTVAQLAFLGLLLATERRFPEVRSAPAGASTKATRAASRAVFASALVVLLLLYQVLSAMGSWLLDYILFNRAQARYSGDDLTRFFSGLTALVNLVDILFLALLAGVLMRRFGLRLGLVLNPAVVAVLLAAMTAIVGVSGTAALGLFAVAGAARIADIALTDGTTRTSVNASFQVVPIADRVAVQAVVEGIGVPLAIGATGAVLLILNLLGAGIGGVIVFAAVLSVVWTVVGALMYRSYANALAGEMRRRVLVESEHELGRDDAGLEALLRSDDARDVRLGVELAAGGDGPATAEVAGLAARLAGSADPADRRAAALALGARDAADGTTTLIQLLADPEPAVRAAALDAVASGDAADPEVVRRVVAALEDARTAGNAGRALGRLGAAAVPLLAAAVARDGATRRPALVRAAAFAAAQHGAAVVEPALCDADRTVVLAALDALDAAGGGDAVPPALLDSVFEDAAAHAARALAARESLAGSDGPLRRALEDESDLARRLVVAVLALRHGQRVHDAVRVVDRAGGQRRALGVEALDVVCTREEAAVVLPLVRGDLSADEQAAAFARIESPGRGREAWLADLAGDPGGVWRSSWLALCARHAAGRGG